LDRSATGLRVSRSSLRVVVRCAITGVGLRDGGTSALLFGLASVLLLLLSRLPFLADLLELCTET
jgi:hypothetical protein